MRGLVYKTMLSMFKLFVRIGFHYGAAWILAKWTKPLSPGGKYKVLCLNKAVFSDDLNAIDTASKDICFLSFPRLRLSDYVRKHVEDFDALNDGSYHPLLGNTQAQERIYTDMLSLLRHLKRFLDFDLVFAGNYVYVSQQEFVRAVKAVGIPIVVLYKEGLAPLGSMTSRVNDKLYSGKIFTGDKMLFYNDAIKQALLSAKIPGIEESVTSTVGIPRLDPYFSENGSTADGHKIVLFAFDPARKAFRYVSEETKVAEYIQRGEVFQANLIRFCGQHPEFELVVKTKSGQDPKTSFLEMVARHDVETIPENVTITGSVPASELILSSGFVAGFTSTTLLEALILDRYLICPQYQSLLPLSETDFFSDFPEAANYVSDYDQLSELLLNQEGLSKAQPEIKEKILKPLIHETDGRASERVYMELLSLLNKN